MSFHPSTTTTTMTTTTTNNNNNNNNYKNDTTTTMVVVDLTDNESPTINNNMTTTTSVARLPVTLSLDKKRVSSNSVATTTTNSTTTTSSSYHHHHHHAKARSKTVRAQQQQSQQQSQQQQQQHATQCIDLIDDDGNESDNDDNGEVIMIPNFMNRTILSPNRLRRRQQARKAYKVDPNASMITTIDDIDSPLLSDTINLDPRILNIDPDQRREVIGVGNNNNDSDTEVVTIKTIVAPDAETQVLEVFPDADLVAVKIMLHERMDNAMAVVDYMSQHTYPKSDAAIAYKNTQTLQLSVKDEPEWLYDYMSVNSFVPSYQYRTDSIDLLLCDFPFLSKAGAISCLSKCQHHYAIAHNMLFDAVKCGSSGNNTTTAATKSVVDDDTQYLRILEVVTKRRRLPEEQKQYIASLLNDCKSPTMKTPANRRKVLIMDKILQNERQYVTKKLNDWLQAHTTRRERALKKKIAQENGTAVECACCFDSYPLLDVVQCNNTIVNHIFCLDCIKANTENLIFGNGNLGIDPHTKKLALELKCFHGDGCYSGFSRTALQKALPIKSMNKYDEIQCEINIQYAGLSNEMCSCPKCNFQAYVPTGQNIFECPATHCQFISCRECGDAAHIPLRCDEVQRDKKETEGRLTVEEAISRAKIRNCPSCKRSFIKESGCNKITCGCGMKVCYLCQKNIKDYTHFCQRGHCDHKTCNMCPLYTNAEEDDKRAMLAAGIAAAKEVREKTAGVDVVIDVNRIINAK